MCGICGKLYFNRQKRVEADLINRMSETLRHRGPDEDGVYVDGSVGLGHRRLSIIDLSTGRQPMSNSRKDIWIVFNGEIYNFLELRQDLEKRGYTFTTTSDTEVILALYEAYGTDCVNSLRGMFAFAIWDKSLQRLFLARDRLGKKPLFYSVIHQSLVFASEIKALLQDPTFPREMSMSAMSHYLTYQYIPAPETIFKHIYKLPPAHILVCQHGKITQQRYWRLSYFPKVSLPEQEIEERVISLLEESVKIRMISDVPIGAFLSGGIDSSLVVALMARYSSQPVNTFSIGFKEKAFNELPYARLVAERYGTKHHEFIVEPNAIEILPKLIWHFDEPFGDSSAIPTYYLSQMTGRHVKVALNGDGGDESFAGYLRYLGYKVVELYRHIPLRIRQSLIPFFIQTFSEILKYKWCTRPLRLAQFVNELSFESRELLYTRTLTIFQNEPKLALLHDHIREQVQSLNSLEYMLEYLNSNNVAHFTDKMLYSDIMTYLPGDLLVKMDRMTMAHALEGRSPFLDHKLVEFVATLPAELKLQKTCLKFLLKKIGKTWLPRKILSRKKQGFGVPIGEWFKCELREMLYDTFSSSYLIQEGILKKEPIERILHEHQTGKTSHWHRIWVLLNLELWYRMFIRKV
ncbi:asparagine synthase, glutamine-hydrolyzing [Candidatus Vecturithrix granuli]|uniref:asparagine synthase (glutamine-hydrolyzing) n=1 Tax=Vecturithrix granuli TaxID=1499967 RepID=A0A081BY56_VECG1|nr:asparagine synthase, glutamine-hydrolyzing [Candidatus Vecturithrix granuli]